MLRRNESSWAVLEETHKRHFVAVACRKPRAKPRQWNFTNLNARARIGSLHDGIAVLIVAVLQVAGISKILSQKKLEPMTDF